MVRTRLVFVLFFLFFCRTVPTGAATFDYPANLNAEQTVVDDVYMISTTAAMQGKVVGDLMALGKTLACPGAVAGDLLAIGLQVDFDGMVNDDVRMLGFNTDLRGNVGDDAVLTGFKVFLSPEARIGHTTVVTAKQAILHGQMRGDLIVNAYDCLIGGNVEGNVKAAAAKLQLTPTAHIKGDLIYAGQETLIVPPGAIIEGEIIQQQAPSPAGFLFLPSGEGRHWAKLAGFAAWDAGLIIIGAGLLLFMPQTVHTPSKVMMSKPGLACFYGFLWLVGAPIIASLGLVTIIGLPLSIAIVFLYVSGLYLSSLPVALWLGEKLCRTRSRPYLSLTIGLLMISLCRALPYIGMVFGLLVLTVGLGSLALSFRNFLREMAKP
ncbi:MAG TPA: polymer-forming cytoskeletal protein [Negativicutes bacterium]|nr:polymer-forming cytoskeletal protein [Negativicutes bacterium]